MSSAGTGSAGAGSTATDRILVFIPGYNCGQQVGRVIAKLAMDGAPPAAEILVVDNQSKDDTVDAAAKALRAAALPRWKVVRNRSNYNLGGSHKLAFDYAVQNGFSHVIVLHGDDQADIRDFAGPIRDGLHRKHDSLLGARFMPGAKLQGYSLYRRIGNYGLNAICSVLLMRGIADQGSGLNMYSTKYLASGFYRGFDDTLIFPNLMFLHGVMSGSDYRFVPITWREEDQVSNAKAVSQAVRVIRLVAARRRTMAALQTAEAPAGRGFDVLASEG